MRLLPVIRIADIGSHTYPNGRISIAASPRSLSYALTSPAISARPLCMRRCIRPSDLTSDSYSSFLPQIPYRSTRSRHALVIPRRSFHFTAPGPDFDQSSASSCFSWHSHNMGSSILCHTCYSSDWTPLSRSTVIWRTCTVGTSMLTAPSPPRSRRATEFWSSAGRHSSGIHQTQIHSDSAWQPANRQMQRRYNRRHALSRSRDCWPLAAFLHGLS